MTAAFSFVLLGLFLIALAYAFINSTPAAIAAFLKKLIPILMILLGIGLTAVGRGGIGLPLAFIGGSLAFRNRGVGRVSNSGPTQTSKVRSDWLEMELDHDTGDLEGIVLKGDFKNRFLADLTDQQVLDLYNQVMSDSQSVGLLEAYLDRRIPTWRENTQTGSSTGNGHSSGSGPMSKQEAYQILGLLEGASTSEIKTAHRRLMKAVHPDSGGSTFLAARINEAKDTLLN